MKTISLTQGCEAIVDDDDYLELSVHSWCLHGGAYAARGFRHNGKLFIERMHQRVIGIPPTGFEIDHINGNKLDNRKSNLRFVTHQQNTFNAKHRVTPKPGIKPSYYKGVVWRNDRNKWRASITHNGKKHYLGLYETQKEAAIAYNKATQELFGEYARLNVIQEDR